MPVTVSFGSATADTRAMYCDGDNASSGPLTVQRFGLTSESNSS